MKQKHTIISIGGIIGAISIGYFGPVYAIEPPADDAQPPAPLNEQADREPGPSGQDQAIPFIGLATASLPEMVAVHLDLSPGSGVIIRTVYPGGPAADAGLSVNDIILSMDGKAVDSPEVVSSVIGELKVGDRLSVDLIHRGKPAKVEVTIGKRPAELVAQLGQEPMLGGIPEQHANRLQGLLEQDRRAFGQGIGPGGVFPDAQFDETFRLMRERMNQAMGAAPLMDLGADQGIQLHQSSAIRVMDDNGSIEIKTSGENTEVTVRDVDNEIVWAGPWDTKQDKAAAPEEIRERIGKVAAGHGGGLGLHFGNLKPAPGN